MSKPKVLVTGANKSQTTHNYHLKQRLKVVPAQYSLYNCLTDMGYEVEQRAVKLGEDLSSYDHVIVYIAGPRQLVAGLTYECLWAISNRADCILAVDDHQAPDLFKSLTKCVNPTELFHEFILGINKKTLEDVKPYEADFQRALKTITDMQNRMLICAFSTAHLDPATAGPHLLFDKLKYPKDRLFTFNPNPYHRNRSWEDSADLGLEDPHWKQPLLSYTVGPRPQKERRFNFASLVQSKTKKWLLKQGYKENPASDEEGLIGTWPVELYGSKAESQKRLVEEDMVKVITRDWGCLMPSYNHAGSGWWRARPLQCAGAGSILIGDKKELQVYYGLDYPFYDLTAADLVELSDDELKEVAETQREAIYRFHPLDKEVEKAELQRVLDAK